MIPIKWTLWQKFPLRQNLKKDAIKLALEKEPDIKYCENCPHYEVKKNKKGCLK